MDETERNQHPQQPVHQGLLRRRREQNRHCVVNLSWWRSYPVGYLICPFLIVIATITDLAMQRFGLRLYTPGAPFFIATLLLAWLWGIGPALLGIVLAFLVLDIVFIPPYGLPSYRSWNDVMILLPFIVTQLLVVLITTQREKARREALATTRELAETNQALAQSNNQLEQINSHLAEVNQLKDYFLSQASHELKNPITTIRGQTQLLLRRLAKPQHTVLEPLSLPNSLAKIEEQTHRLQTLIDDLLDISSLNSGKIPLRLTQCNLAVLCSKVIDDQCALFDRCIELKLPSEPLILQADAQRLTQVIINLVSNAVKYSPENSVVRVSASQENKNFVIMVHNEDPVIPQEQQTRIFEPFYRTPEAECSSIPGSGLGLAISKEIVEQHGGQISVESSEEKGTTFFVRLPLQGVSS